MTKFISPPQQSASMAVYTELQHLSTLDIDSEASKFTQTGIICTIGPASTNPSILEQMMEAGMTIARLNFSHGSYEYHAETIKNIRTATDNYSKKIGRIYPLAVALDTKGPEIRTGSLEGNANAEIELKKGESVKLTTNEQYRDKCNANFIYVDYENIIKVLQPEKKVYIDDGLISLLVKEISSDTITCEIQNGGMLGSKKGVNLPGIAVDLPNVSEKDKNDLKFGVEQEVDMIFASFIRSASAISEIKSILGCKGNKILVISKIENHQGVRNLNEIIEASDGIMVARGDLGIEIPTEKVFLAQKLMTSKCNKSGKPIICATQMLESMIKKPRPTRAESSDVANAVLDGADCVMLSGESAKGEYPLECVKTQASICREAEAAFWQKRIFNDLLQELEIPVDPLHGLAVSAVQASVICEVSAIVVVSSTGRSAHLISKYRPRCAVVAVTTEPHIARQMQLYRSLVPVIYETASKSIDEGKEIENRINFGINIAKEMGLIKCGGNIIAVSGSKQTSTFCAKIIAVK